MNTLSSFSQKSSVLMVRMKGILKPTCPAEEFYPAIKKWLHAKGECVIATALKSLAVNAKSMGLYPPDLSVQIKDLLSKTDQKVNQCMPTNTHRFLRQ